MDPTGVILQSRSGTPVAQITQTAPLSGTYTILDSSADLGKDSIGSYEVYLAVVPERYLVLPDDEGGIIASNGDETGIIHPGDLDLGTFQARGGAFVWVSVQEIQDNNGF